ncbi:hypothetical protein [Aliiroseovarius sp.]|uniref:hypothetical protein n=1 Tax=Aliiroseovarius sp. TaxID=1872442 RepID=UPI003BACF4F3
MPLLPVKPSLSVLGVLIALGTTAMAAPVSAEGKLTPAQTGVVNKRGPLDQPNDKVVTRPYPQANASLHVLGDDWAEQTLDDMVEPADGPF